MTMETSGAASARHPAVMTCSSGCVIDGSLQLFDDIGAGIAIIVQEDQDLPARRPGAGIAAAHPARGQVLDRSDRLRRAAREGIEKPRRFVRGTVVNHDQRPGRIALYGADLLETADQLAHAIARGDDDRHGLNAGVGFHARLMRPKFRHPSNSWPALPEITLSKRGSESLRHIWAEEFTEQIRPDAGAACSKGRTEVYPP